MKRIFLMLLIAVVTLTATSEVKAQVFAIGVGGSFAKPKIIPEMDKLALAQITIRYKVTSTAKAVGKDGSYGTVAGAKISAYLETTDGPLTSEDFQEVTDYFYSYMQKQLKANGIDTIAWSTIAATDFYQNGAEKPDKGKTSQNENVWMTSSAHKGNELYGGGIAFVMGKAKRAGAFCEQLGAPAAFLYLTVDFADVMVGIEISTSKESNMFYSKTTEKKKYSWAVRPETKVMAMTPTSGFSLFWNEKNQAETLIQRKDIDSGATYHTNIDEDRSKLKNSMWAFRKEMTPIVIETTRERYKAAAKKALEKFADTFVSQRKDMKKN
jgi:hypothetical protein